MLHCASCDGGDHLIVVSSPHAPKGFSASRMSGHPILLLSLLIYIAYLNPILMHNETPQASHHNETGQQVYIKSSPVVYTPTQVTRPHPAPQVQ